MGIETLNRTRFLAELDTMLMRDRRGAIDDMLQVLREYGAIKQAFSEQRMDNRRLELDGYRDHCKRAAAVSIGHLLLNDGVIEFKQAEESPEITKLTGTATFVTRKEG